MLRQAGLDLFATPFVLAMFVVVFVLTLQENS
jgi:hypothetical protein